jgi:hypothetical protein
MFLVARWHSSTVRTVLRYWLCTLLLLTALSALNGCVIHEHNNDHDRHERDRDRRHGDHRDNDHHDNDHDRDRDRDRRDRDRH